MTPVAAPLAAALPLPAGSSVREPAKPSFAALVDHPGEKTARAETRDAARKAADHVKPPPEDDAAPREGSVVSGPPDRLAPADSETTRKAQDGASAYTAVTPAIPAQAAAAGALPSPAIPAEAPPPRTAGPQRVASQTATPPASAPSAIGQAAATQLASPASPPAAVAPAAPTGTLPAPSPNLSSRSAPSSRIGPGPVASRSAAAVAGSLDPAATASLAAAPAAGASPVVAAASADGDGPAGQGEDAQVPQDAAAEAQPSAPGNAFVPQAPPPAAVAAQAAAAEPATVQSLTAEIVRKLDQRISRFEVALNPAGLGRVNVALEIGAGRALSAAMTFERPHAAAELQARAHELTAALKDAGFDVAAGALSFAATPGGLSGDGSGRSPGHLFSAFQQHGGERGGSSEARAFGDASDLAEDLPLASRRAVRGLDIHV